MTVLRVDGTARRLRFGEIAMPCAIGRGGVCQIADKREGDGCTPLGRWPLRGVLLRPGKAQSHGIRLPWRWVRDGDGWSDDPADPAYNRPVRLPRAFSAENLLRADDAYDVVVVLGHNDAPPVPGRGSAIFFHLSEGRPTAGCVAVERADMLRLLPMLQPGDGMEII
ncbi:L,D-peptidoglycan transpeptidase YkuD (ErfK/YbiS/YcfS/YnhG family) [Sphingobium wenxiniae]|uniref:L,D-peptidoglycan transpeptidase YkuD (ErfK/YbiS/YcfS/YnhG family) n=1 Tax=Sphingobium wenxiniae (strain DSM 21828 / CGMCC 1.7748 / JZ-1) TaxID=595605 RepID=A0A562K8M0_SPHWJ|nr:L,D-transpeptidase family protein [Sphingobium wenxiniae]MBB6192409.1 L,D-peptidoglycan transpeptidase YkuD (ErfK/YbiS/YcfS/YnhG family) [Sphingobium wenxiniae]TWH91779.1 L,D-peptidoglycan transpeptidase YkuD (ErfK/YbiS/YcfS/YnhG family) [Sphingobium wenxiniae]